jgi:hypothetical protein
MSRSSATFVFVAVLGTLVVSPLAHADEAISVRFGLGGGFWSLNKKSLEASLSKKENLDSGLLADEVGDGMAIRFALEFDLGGYVSLELGASGHGYNLSGGIGGTMHATGVLRFHPLEAFFPERNYDASVFAGGGYSMFGGGHKDSDDNRALTGGVAEFGFGGRYEFVDWFSLGAEYRIAIPFYDTWEVDMFGGEDHGLGFSPDMLFHALFLMINFHA